MAWTIDYEHDSEEVITLKKRIAEQDNHCSTVQGQLIKTKSALDENKAALDETTYKLRYEADRALRLGEELRECRENLEREKLMRQNADLAVHNAAGKEKQEEVERRELQQTLESISSRETASNTIISNLRNEKLALERRMRELEANLQQVISAATPKRRGRGRSSSFSDVRITALERDLGESQASVIDLRAELGKAQEKLRRTEKDLFRTENEKTVLERRTADEMKSIREKLASKDEEILRHSGGGDVRLAQEREEELIRRVEEEEAKVLALERLLSETSDLKEMESALQKARKQLAAEIGRVKSLEEKNAGLSRDMRRVRDTLDESRAHAQSLGVALDEKHSLIHSSQAQERALRAQVNALREEVTSLKAEQSGVPTSGAPYLNDGPGAITDVETVEKLLTAVNRLRSERDELRRQLEFLQIESKFTIEALEDKINSGVPCTGTAKAVEDPRISQLQSEVQELLERLAKANSRFRMDLTSSTTVSSRLGLIASASLAMVGHLQTRVDHEIEVNKEARVEIPRLSSQLQDSLASKDESLRASHGLQQSLLDIKHQLESNISSLHDTQQQRDDLLLQIEHLRSQVAANDCLREQYQELQSSLEGTAARLSDVTKALEDAESERNSLKVEVVNLREDMTSAQEEMKQAEQRYSVLQNQQLSAMSSTQINRKLKEQIEELEDRVARRTEQIGIHQHDIRRLETNLKLQEDRIAEMTSELEIAMSEKESMVEDCADAREARDRALKKAEDLEDTVETLDTQLHASEEQRDSEVVALVGVWFSMLTKSRLSLAHLRSVAYEASATNADMAQRLQLVSAKCDSAMTLLGQRASELESAHKVAAARNEDVRSGVIALSVVQTSAAEFRRGVQLDRDRIRALLAATRDEVNVLQDQLRRRREQELAESTEQQTAHSAEVAKLQQTNADLDRLCAKLEDDLAQSQEELHLAVDQRDQLRVNSDVMKEQIAQLRLDHSEELESLRGKLQQVAVDLQEAREAHAAAEKACLESSATNAELEGRLDRILKQQEADSELIVEHQGREAEHTKQVLDIQNRLEKVSEDLQRATREKNELEILLRQTKAELSRANDAMETRVSELLDERDGLQADLDQVESRHATEVVQVQGRVQDLQAEVNSLREQLDKAIADHKRMRAVFETELRESAERYESSRKQRDDIQAQLSTLETELDDMEARLQTTVEEKGALDEKNTNLESEIQRALSMQRYLESQLKDSAHEAAVVKAELEQIKEKFANAERNGNAAEMQLTLQAAQHDQAIASLKREIQLAQAGERQDEKIQELEERISHMDELMRSKTQEIEENDDRFIELHKEKKKLTAKVETLSRKVQTLQSKLATLKEAAANQNPGQSTVPTSEQIPLSKQAIPVARVPFTRSSHPTSAAASGSPSRSRTMSGPSALLGRKTPDNRPTPSVFRAKTPEPTKAPISELQSSLSTTIVAGKKRAAPDDGDDAVPTQGFTSDGVLAIDRNTASTPRRRKSLRTGFTPVRNTTTRPLTTLVLEPAAPVPPPPVILDVTNSPRSQPQTQTDIKVKRSWLGTQKSKPVQSSNNPAVRTTSARPGATEKVR